MNIMLDPGAIMPERAHKADAGLDLFSPIETWLNPFCQAVIDTGVHVQIPYGFVGLLTSKSGLMAKHGITSTGTIDAQFTGSIKAVLFNHGHEIVHIEKGAKITQLVITQCMMPHLDLVDSFPETERGENGFGSTGYRAKSYFDLCHDPNRERRHSYDQNQNANCGTCNGDLESCCPIDFEAIDKKLNDQNKQTPTETMKELTDMVNDENGLFGQMGLV